MIYTLKSYLNSLDKKLILKEINYLDKKLLLNIIIININSIIKDNINQILWT